MSEWATYKNGNYFVKFNLGDGTKIKYNDYDCFIPEYSESIDLKITNKCYGVNGSLCEMCHENSCPSGKHGDIMNLSFVDTMMPYTELAVGGGDPLTHPDLIPFLKKLSHKNVIANVTVNQWSFIEQNDYVKSFVDNKLIHGLGVSLNDTNDEFISAIKEFPNAVVHVINGIVTIEQLRKLKDSGLKILILGYKEFRRGKSLYNNDGEHIDALKSSLYDMLPTIIEEEWFDVVSFDNLAIEQLNPKRLMSDDEWQSFFAGEDGQFTFYIDAVEQKFAQSSTAEKRYDLLDDMKDMFNIVRNEC